MKGRLIDSGRSKIFPKDAAPPARFILRAMVQVLVLTPLKWLGIGLWHALVWTWPPVAVFFGLRSMGAGLTAASFLTLGATLGWWPYRVAATGGDLPTVTEAVTKRARRLEAADEARRAQGGALSIVEAK